MSRTQKGPKYASLNAGRGTPTNGKSKKSKKEDPTKDEKLKSSPIKPSKEPEPDMSYHT